MKSLLSTVLNCRTSSCATLNFCIASGTPRPFKKSSGAIFSVPTQAST